MLDTSQVIPCLELGLVSSRGPTVYRHLQIYGKVILLKNGFSVSYSDARWIWQAVDLIM
jgi:hypothetical protein